MLIKYTEVNNIILKEFPKSEVGSTKKQITILPGILYIHYSLERLNVINNHRVNSSIWTAQEVAEMLISKVKDYLQEQS